MPTRGEGEVSTVYLTVKVKVHDPAKLLEYAKKRYRAAWIGELAEPVDIDVAVREALICSSEGPNPVEYGIEILEIETDLAP